MNRDRDRLGLLDRRVDGHVTGVRARTRDARSADLRPGQGWRRPDGRCGGDGSRRQVRPRRPCRFDRDYRIGSVSGAEKRLSLDDAVSSDRRRRRAIVLAGTGAYVWEPVACSRDRPEPCRCGDRGLLLLESNERAGRLRGAGFVDRHRQKLRRPSKRADDQEAVDLRHR